MSMQQQIETKLKKVFEPHFLQVDNESHMHGGPSTESHYKVTLVSDYFNGKRLLARHRGVNEVLSDELATKIHALALHTYTREEWQQRSEAPQSPSCMGGSQRS